MTAGPTATSLAITPEQHELTEAFGRFAAHHAPVSETRANLAALADGQLPVWWPDLVENGFHVVHVPERLGGQGGELADMACVLQAAGAAMLPGPLLHSAVVSAVLAGDDTALFKEIIAGTPAVVALPEHCDFVGRRTGEGWTLTGSSGAMPGMLAAQRVLVPFRCHDGGDDGVLRWAAVDPAGCDVEARTGTDLTTDLGVLRLHDHSVSDAALLTDVDTDHATNVTVAFTASVVAGIMQWCVRTVTEHLRTREQFGKPIGTFQAMQHKAAMLLVNSELATAAAWDAVRALSISDDPVQHRAAVATAVVTAVAPAPGLVLEALTMLGAIGFTWEHDLHLYWRRATSLAASLGPVSRWTRELGELSTPRELKVDLDSEENTADSQFRAHVADVLDRASALPEDTGGEDAPQGHGREFVTGARRDLLAEAGLIAPHWPAPWGCDATVRRLLVVDEEFARRLGLIRPSVGIAEWILPTIISAGTEDLQRRFIPRDAARTTRMVPAVQRARRGKRPGVAEHARGPRRRRLADHRPQDLDILGTPRRLRCAARAHRPRCAQTPWHRLLHRRHAVAGHRGAPDHAGQWAFGVQRGVPHRRVRARRHAARRTHVGLATGDQHHGTRAGRDQWLRAHRPHGCPAEFGGNRHHRA